MGDWAWYGGDNEELYRVGPCGSRQEALEEGLFYFGDAPTIHLLEACSQDWPPPSADSVIDGMFENSDDLFAEDYPEPAGTKEQMREAEAELQAALNAWMHRWRSVIFPAPTRFSSSRNGELVVTPLGRAVEAIKSIADWLTPPPPAGPNEEE